MARTHGIRGTYTAGCRCDACCSANTAYMSKYRREYSTATPRPAWRNSRLWEPWEDDLVSDYTKSAQQIADMLERTLVAVTNRRRILNARRNKKSM